MAKPLPNGSAPLNKMAARAINRKKALKDFFCKTSQCMDFEIIIQEYSLRDCVQNCSNRSTLWNKMAARAINRKKLETISSAKSMDRFLNNLVPMIFR